MSHRHPDENVPHDNVASHSLPHDKYLVPSHKNPAVYFQQYVLTVNNVDPATAWPHDNVKVAFTLKNRTDELHRGFVVGNVVRGNANEESLSSGQMILRGNRVDVRDLAPPQSISGANPVMTWGSPADFILVANSETGFERAVERVRRHRCDAVGDPHGLDPKRR